MDNLEQRLKDIVSEQLNITADQIRPEMMFVEDLGADSLDTVELVIALEREFDIDIENEEAEKMISFLDMVEFIKGRVIQHASPML